ncbi:hypothetical protein Hanom_Chr04g00372811 [Helianthus anomalus]
MKNRNKSNEANAHNKNNIWRDFQSRGIIRVELEHVPGCSTSRPSSAASLPPSQVGGSGSRTSSWWSCSIQSHFCTCTTDDLNII